MSRQSAAFRQKRLEQFLDQLRAQHQAAYERFRAETADDPGWKALHSDPEWLALAKKWEQAGRPAHADTIEKADLLEAMHSLLADYGLLSDESSDARAKLAEECAIELQCIIRAERIVPINMQHTRRRIQELYDAASELDVASMPQRPTEIADTAAAKREIEALWAWCIRQGQSSPPPAPKEEQPPDPKRRKKSAIRNWTPERLRAEILPLIKQNPKITPSGVADRLGCSASTITRKYNEDPSFSEWFDKRCSEEQSKAR